MSYTEKSGQTNFDSLVLSISQKVRRLDAFFAATGTGNIVKHERLRRPKKALKQKFLNCLNTFPRHVWVEDDARAKIVQ